MNELSGDARFVRLRRLTLIYLAILAAGLLYAWLVRLVGAGIPCVFRLTTGLLCPGCGVSRMCLALLRLDFAAAWSYNPAIMALLPLGAAVAADMSLRYVISGDKQGDRFCKIAMVFMIAALLVFGIVRNITE